MFDEDGREREVVRLEGEIAEVSGLLNATHARLVGLIADVLAVDGWTGRDIRSPEHWVAWQCGVSASHAHRLVLMARRLHGLPRAEAAFTAGELSEDQAAVVARYAPEHNDGEITELARSATVSQLSRTLRSYPFVEPDTTEPETEERREVSFGFTDTGRWRLSADLPADEGALVERTLSAQRDHLFRQPDGEPVTWADAFLAMADVAGTAMCSGRGPADRCTVLVHLDAGAHLNPSPTCTRDRPCPTRCAAT